LTDYDALSSVYDFLLPEVLLDPRGSVAALREWLDEVPPGAAVLDCACGPGHLAVGLAQAGFAVTATDASPAMCSRASALADSHGVRIAVERVTWDELADQDWDDRFAAVCCVGNSLAHAEGAAARRRALRNMSRLLGDEGRLFVTSRNWELVRSKGSHLQVAEAIAARGGRRGLVIHNWTLPERWADRHGLEIAVAQLDDGDAVQTVAEQLAFWPFRHDELLDDLAAARLRIATTTYAGDVERYLVVAVR